MRVFLPRPGEAIARVETQDGRIEPPMGPEWYRWVQLLWTSLGWNPATPIYNDLLPAVETSTGNTTIVTGNLRAISFSAGGGNRIVGGFALPNSYQEGTSVTPFMVVAGLGVGSGDVRLNFSAGTATPGSSFSESIAQTQDVTLDTAAELVRVEFTEIAGTGLTRGTYIPFTFEREGGATEDTYPNNMGVIAVGLKVQVQGSGQEARFP